MEAEELRAKEIELKRQLGEIRNRLNEIYQLEYCKKFDLYVGDIVEVEVKFPPDDKRKPRPKRKGVITGFGYLFNNVDTPDYFRIKYYLGDGKLSNYAFELHADISKVTLIKRAEK